MIHNFKSIRSCGRIRDSNSELLLKSNFVAPLPQRYIENCGKFHYIQKSRPLSVVSKYAKSEDLHTL